MTFVKLGALSTTVYRGVKMKPRHVLAILIIFKTIHVLYATSEADVGFEDGQEKGKGPKLPVGKCVQTFGLNCSTCPSSRR